MRNNITLSNISYIGCNINWETVIEVWFHIVIVFSVASFVGNILVILVVFQIRTLRTTTNCLVVSMAASDVFVPTMELLYFILVNRKDAGYLSQTFGTVVCKFLFFVYNVSYGMSMFSLVVITVIRFYAVAFPMSARLQSRRTIVIFLVLAWLVPIATFGPMLFFLKFNLQYHLCYVVMSIHQRRIYIPIYSSLFFLLPLLVMLVLYPVIIFKLRRQKIPGNANCPRALIRRRKQNLRLTAMFITIAVAFMLTWGICQIMNFIFLFSILTDWCTFRKIDNIVLVLPNVFHAINPVIYFIFCSSYRQGIKQIFSCCCCHTHKHHAPGGDQIELGNIPQV